MRSQCLRDPEARELQETGETTLIREVKPQPRYDAFNSDVRTAVTFRGATQCAVGPNSRASIDGWLRSEIGKLPCPLGAVGEKRWVRETWATNWKEQTITRAEWDILYDMLSLPTSVSADTVDWKPAVTMPRWASRATVEVVESDVFQDGGVWYWRAKYRKVSDGQT